MEYFFLLDDMPTRVVYSVSFILFLDNSHNSTMFLNLEGAQEKKETMRRKTHSVWLRCKDSLFGKIALKRVKTILVIQD